MIICSDVPIKFVDGISIHEEDKINSEIFSVGTFRKILRVYGTYGVYPMGTLLII